MRNRGMVLAVAGILLLAFALGATGVVDLSGTGEALSDAPDRMIGVLLTKDYLDLFDVGALLQDLPGSLNAGREQIIKDSTQNQGRLFASLRSEEHPTQDGGTQSQDTYEFEGVNGLALYFMEIQMDGEPRWTNRIDPAFSQAKTGLGDQENKTEISLEGTLWLTDDGGVTALMINPVYQMPTGEVYAVSGSGMDFSGNMGEVLAISTKLESSLTEQKEGEERAFSTTVEVHFRSMKPPQRYELLQLDRDSTVISRLSYTPQDMPEDISLQKDTAYLILERFSDQQNPQEQPLRILYQREDAILNYFTAREDGFCVGHDANILWGDSSD